MSFSWAEYLTVAEALVHARSRFAPADARYRVAISRAYYAAYCSARNHAQAYEGYTPVASAGDHERVRRHYDARRDTPHQKIARILERLRVERNRADYDNSIPDPLRPLALFVIEQARVVFTSLHAICVTLGVPSSPLP